MQSIFTIHAGEFLVGDHLTRRAGKQFDVWIPAKDSGVDLLLTRREKPRRAIRLQVKFSRSYDRSQFGVERFVGRGWYTLKPVKIRMSIADFWVFVILDVRLRAHFITIPVGDLKRRIPNGSNVWHLYLTIAGKPTRCMNTRGLPAKEAHSCFDARERYFERDFTKYLDDRGWELLRRFSK
jgi:hypothetical protein